MIKLFEYIRDKRKSILLIILILCLNGLISLYVNKKENIPYQKFHGFKLEVFYPEGTPEIIESLITSKLVEILISLDYVKNIYSTSSYGKSEIVFDTDEDELNTILEKVERSWDQFVKEVSQPIISSLEFSDSAFLKIAILNENPGELQEIKKEILRIEGVKHVTGKENSLEEIIEYDDNKLELIGLTHKTLSSYFSNESKKSYLGNLREKSSDKGVMSRGIFIEPSQNINSIPFYVPFSSFSERKIIERKEKTFYNGKPTTVLSISLHTWESIFSISNQIISILDGHTNINYKVVYNKIDYSLKNIHEFIYSLLITLSICIIYNYTLYKNKKITYLLISISIITLLITFLVHYLLDKSLNLYTFTGISLAVGMLFDNSNTIFILLSSKRSTERMKIFNNLQLSLRSSLFSLLTTIIVFLPIFSLKSRVAYILKEICFSFMIMLIINYIITYLVVVLSLNEKDSIVFFVNKTIENRSFHIKNIYNKYIKKYNINIQTIMILFTILLSILLFSFSPKSIYPKSKVGGIFLKLEIANENSRNIKNIPEEFDRYLGKSLDISSYIRKDSINLSEWTIIFAKPLLETEISDLLQKFGCEVCKISYINLDSISNEIIFSEMNNEILVFQDIDQFELKNQLDENKTNKNISNYTFLSNQKINILSPKLEKLSITIQKDNKIRDIFKNSQKMYITVLDNNTKKENSIPIVSREDKHFNLEQNIQDYYKSTQKEANVIHSRGGISYLPIRFDGSNENLLNNLEKKFPINRFELREERATNEIIFELIKSLILSILLLFLFIYYIYESIYFCILILSSLLFVVSISIIAIFLFCSTFNVTSYLGIILLSGLSVDSIILFLEKLDTTKSINLRLILKIKKEIKPIVKINIYTTLFGLISIIIVSGVYHFQSGLVIPILGGLAGLYFYFEYIFPYLLLTIFKFTKKYES